MPGGGFLAEFAPIAQFIKSKRRKWPDQGKTGGDRKQERQDRVAKRYSRQNDSNYRIDNAKDDGVAGNRLEVFPAQPQRIEQVG
jgi:hypothetical protein